jgi:hypothetical protein
MHLVIEPSPDWAASPNVDNPIWTLTFASQDTVGFVYATVRDVYGNYVMPSHNAVWFSRDTAVVWVTHGRDSLGEGVLHNTRAGGSAIVGACDSSIQSCDSFVVNAPYPYPGCTLTVAVGHAGPPLDTLRAEVGDSIRLTVLAGTLTEPRIWSTPGELRWVLYPAPDTIRVAIPAPSAAADWLFCPLSQGHATLNVWSEHADCWLNLPVLVTEIAAIGRARDAASGSGPGPLLRIGGLCLTIPAGAVKAEVRGFDLRGRIMWCRTILLGAQPHLLAEAVPGLTVVQMRWLARDGHEVSRQATTLEQAR